MWVEQPLAGDPAGDPAPFDYTIRVAEDAVYLLGNISDTTIFGHGSTAVTLSPLGGTDLFIARFSID